MCETAIILKFANASIIIMRLIAGKVSEFFICHVVAMITKLLETVPSIRNAAPDFPFLQLGVEEERDRQFKFHFRENNAPNPVRNIFSAITYHDSSGLLLSRRITALRLQTHWNVPSLVAWCHETNGVRIFNCHKVVSFSTTDGETFTPKEFWERIGINPVDVSRKHIAPEHKLLLKLLGQEFNILLALARYGEQIESREFNIIIGYLETELKRAKIYPSKDEWAQIKNYARLVRPVREDIAVAVENLLPGKFNHHLRLNGQRAESFFGAALGLVDVHLSSIIVAASEMKAVKL